MKPVNSFILLDESIKSMTTLSGFGVGVTLA
jgi:hypothetical protein